MIEFVWEYVIKKESRGQFELAFGPGGMWGNMFLRSQGYRGTTLLRDTKDLRRYLVIDLWDSETQREQVLSERKEDYTKLHTSFIDWSESMTEMGVFRVLAEGTVRPTAKARRYEAGETGRRSRRTNRWK